MLNVLLADAEVELAPQEIAGHPDIRNSARERGSKPSDVLLDQNLHGAAIRKLPDGKRRGRPDILHHLLMVLLESPLNKGGELRVAVHTRHGVLMRMRQDMRLPRGEARFQGILAKVLREGASQEEEPLWWVVKNCDPGEALASFAKGPVRRLDEVAEMTSPAKIVELAQGGDLTLVIGAFPSGDFSKEWKDAAPNAVSIWPLPLNAWAVAGELVAAYRARWGPEAPPPTATPTAPSLPSSLSP